MTQSPLTSPETNAIDANEAGAATEHPIIAVTTEPEHPLTGGGQTVVARRGDVVLRPAGAWTPAVHALLRRLEAVGYDAAPRLVGTGFAADGRETVRFIPGALWNPRPWRDAAMPVLGRMLRALHDATATFQPPAEARWRRRFSYELGGDDIVIGHGDVAPWNVIAREGIPVALIDWEYAGPIARRLELAQACWLNARLFDDDVAAREGLASAADRARQVRLLLDGYGLDRNGRAGVVDAMVEYAVHDAAADVIETNVSPDNLDPAMLWGVTWKTRSAAWMLRHRGVLEGALA